MSGQLVQSLRECGAVFDRLGISYAVMGGVAVRAYAVPRPTFDVDFTLVLPRERLAELFAALEELGYTVPDAYRAGWVDTVAGMSLVKARFYVGEQGVDVDMFLAESAFQRSLMSRRRKDIVEDVETWIVSAEDLVLLKLVAARPRDLIDVADILFIQGQLDSEYLRHWADQLGVRPNLERALAESAETDERP